MKITLSSLTLTMLLISACASMNKEDCLQANWSELGKNDGQEGHDLEHFHSRKKSCQEHGISANKRAYLQGHKEGLKKYCNYQNGFELGKEGEDYKTHCPKEFQKEYLSGYRAGKSLYEQKQFYKNIEAENVRSRIELIKGQAQGKSCSNSIDCDIEDECFESKCRLTGKACSFDSHCEIDGTCWSNRCDYD